MVERVPLLSVAVVVGGLLDRPLTKKGETGRLSATSDLLNR